MTFYYNDQEEQYNTTIKKNQDHENQKENQEHNGSCTQESTQKEWNLDLHKLLKVLQL